MVAHSAPIRFIEVQPSCRATKREAEGERERERERGAGEGGGGVGGVEGGETR